MPVDSTPAARYVEHIVPFQAGDGRPLNLVHIQGHREPTKGPVVLVHGAGVRANIFRAPVKQTVVDALLEAGYDVWLENWRASIDLEPNEWTLDQAAVHDHPKAIQKIVQETGRDEVKAIVHCQGSTSFMLSAVAGLVPQVKVILSNAVALHPRVPRSAQLKARYAVPLVARMTHYLDPQWGLEAKGFTPKAITLLVKATHHECDNTVCRLASFTYGTGFPTLWRHENLNPETHEWLKHELAKVPLTFFQQMAECLRAGHLVPVEGYRELPEDVSERPPETDARFIFLAGELNQCFLAESQRRTYEHLSRYRPGYHALHVIPEYGHLDIFMGKDAARDVFPLIVSELDKPV
ncbi:alpha/beta fold hydrolase [Hyalangium rubrum]|uniref:Alpha/beta fold hydrolase n=1 Tax=Hyalangium rubrum TaxID=3103134 RepID=A0ABU5HED1_9BACT|nr:alpha/beta fold hydrolase [Hyalangium sp. s54d21]MDY7231813.1 alpha/beta fold hydrolase [Hyalangium sp. s54d21]